MSEIVEKRIAKTFKMLESAAANGERCPQRDDGVRTDDTRFMTARGWIRIYIYFHNYRVVEILAGPHAGKKTAAPTHGHQPWLVIDQTGRHRRMGDQPAAPKTPAQAQPSLPPVSLPPG